ncbi:MAG TPA: type I methionyl aminopeptidase [Gammaproteobacteria bacterium]
MTVENDEQLEKLRVIGRIVANVLQRMMHHSEPGMTTAELDAFGAKLLEHEGARSAPQLTYGFPGATCISVNEEVAHGMPGARVLQAGDVVNVDVSAEKDGYFGDTGGSFVIPPVTPEKQRLCFATREALNNAMREARAGEPLNRIGKAIEQTAKRKGFRVITNLCSHGVGGALHEEPEEIYGYFEPRDDRVLHEGMVITIEPFLSNRNRFVEESGDGWTLIGKAGSISAQYEHSMVITRGQPIVLTQPTV